MAKLTQDEKLKRTRALLSAPSRETMQAMYDLCVGGEPPDLREVAPGVFAVIEKPKRIQPRPDEIGYT